MIFLQEFPRFVLCGLAFLVPLLGAMLLTPAVARLAFKYRLLDHPGDHKMHRRATPFLGGLAVGGGMMLVGLAVAGVNGELFTVVGAARDGAEAVELVAQHQPDLVLMDLKMPNMNGIEATRQICTHYPGVKVLILTTFDDDEWVFDAIRAGAAGDLLKDTPREEVIKAVSVPRQPAHLLCS